MATEQFALRWNNFHSNLTSGFKDLLQANEMVDVTLAVEGQFVQAHKLVLSICSPFFMQLFKMNPCKHPIVILKDVSIGNLQDIIEFMYLGEVNVLRENFSSFLRTAELLQIKGLTGDDCSDTSSKKGERNDDDLEQDIQQFSQLLESCDSVPNDNRNTRSPPLQLATNGKEVKPANNRKRVKVELKPRYESTNDNQDKGNADRFKIKSAYVVESEREDKRNLKFERTFSNLPGACADYGRHEERYIKHPFKCEKCPKHFSRRDHLRTHDKNIHDSKTRNISCPYCCKKFVKKHNLKVHIQDQHEFNNPVNLKCVVCSKKMRNQSSLRVHLYHHRKRGEMSP